LVHYNVTIVGVSEGIRVPVRNPKTLDPTFHPVLHAPVRNPKTLDPSFHPVLHAPVRNPKTIRP